MMKFTFNIKKLHLLIILFVIVVVGVVIAYGTGNPSNFGHSFGELEGVAPNCVRASCPELPASTWGAEASTSRYAARAYVSDYIWDGSNPNSKLSINNLCKSDGVGCGTYYVDTSTPCLSGDQPLACMTTGLTYVSVSPGGPLPHYNSLYRQYFRWNNIPSILKWEYISDNTPGPSTTYAPCTYVLCG